MNASIRTGYFARVKRYEDAGYTVFSIAAHNPTWYKGASIPSLAPSRDLVKRYKNGLISEDDYEKEYMMQLDSLDLQPLLDGCKELHKVIFICYESPRDFCHRHLLAKHLCTKYHVHAEEF